MVKVPLVGIMVKDKILSNVFFPETRELEIELRAIVQKYGANNVSTINLNLMDGKNMYNPLNVGRHAAYSMDMTNAKPQFAT